MTAREWIRQSIWAKGYFWQVQEAYLAEHHSSKRWCPVVLTTVLEHWSAAIATPSLRAAHMGLAGPHNMGPEFIRHMLSESQKVWLAHARARNSLIKAH